MATQNMASIAASLSPVSVPIYSPLNVNRKPSNFHKPHLLSYKQNPISTLHSLRISRVRQRNRLFSIFGSLTDDSANQQVASVDIKLPRRSLLVEFSCNSCGERTKRLINRLAYERGLVFVQCAGCLQHHKLVDNLGLIVEYDFRETSKEV